MRWYWITSMTADMLHQVSSPWENAIPSYFICYSSYPSSSSTVQKLLLSIRYYYSNVLITYGRCTLLIKSCPQNTLGLQGKKDAKQNGCRHLSPAVHGNSGQDDSQIVKLHLSTVLYEKKNRCMYISESRITTLSYSDWEKHLENTVDEIICLRRYT